MCLNAFVSFPSVSFERYRRKYDDGKEEDIEEESARKDIEEESTNLKRGTETTRTADEEP